MWKAIVIGLVAILALVRPAYCTESSIGVTYGNNIWGNTLGLNLEVPVSTHWALQLAYGTGQFAFTTRDEGDFLYLSNLPGKEHRTSLDFKRLVDIAVTYQRNEVSSFRLFNEFGAGIAHVFVRLRDEFEKEDGLTTFRGERDYSRYGVVVMANAMDFRPGADGDIEFSLGLRSKLIWIDSPQELHYTDGAGRYDTKTNEARHGDTLYFPYPELFLTAKYCF